MKRYLLLLVLIVPISVVAQVSRWVTNDCSSGEGTGTYIWANGETYEGQCLNERLNGQGTLFMANGDRYVGQWQSTPVLHRIGR